MSEMVERVARALQAASEGDASEWTQWVREARAAIEAMREATTEMARAASDPYTEGRDEYWLRDEAWPAMIDAALTHGPSETQP